MAASDSAAETANIANSATSLHCDSLEGEGVKPTSSRTLWYWKFRMRPEDDDEDQDWWFASTAIPLLAATTGPLANVMSIAALITPWRAKYQVDYLGQDSYAVGFPDPRWCIALNAASLACGFIGNIFLLFNFTRRIRCRSRNSILLLYSIIFHRLGTTRVF